MFTGGASSQPKEEERVKIVTPTPTHTPTCTVCLHVLPNPIELLFSSAHICTCFSVAPAEAALHLSLWTPARPDALTSTKSAEKTFTFVDLGFESWVCGKEAKEWIQPKSRSISLTSSGSSYRTFPTLAP